MVDRKELKREIESWAEIVYRRENLLHEGQEKVQSLKDQLVKLNTLKDGDIIEEIGWSKRVIFIAKGSDKAEIHYYGGYRDCFPLDWVQGKVDAGHWKVVGNVFDRS